MTFTILVKKFHEIISAIQKYGKIFNYNMILYFSYAVMLCDTKVRILMVRLGLS